jgi:hypothetical protein
VTLVLRESVWISIKGQPILGDGVVDPVRRPQACRSQLDIIALGPFLCGRSRRSPIGRHPAVCSSLTGVTLIDAAASDVLVGTLRRVDARGQSCRASPTARRAGAHPSGCRLACPRRC